MVYENYWALKKKLRLPFDKAEHLRRTAKALKLSKTALLRLEWMLFHQAEGNARLTCRHFHISPKTFYKWFNIFDESNLRTLEDKSKEPKRKRRKQVTMIEEQRIIKLRKEHIRWGKMKIARLYSAIYEEKISSWKIQYTIKKHKLYFNPIKNIKLQQKRKRSDTMTIERARRT